jgi:hypothetical protein
VKLPRFKKKYLAIAATAALVMGAAGIAAAYFGAGGSGTGKGTVGTTVALKIHQVGAGYESVIPAKTGTDPYVGDQCLQNCTADLLTQLGDRVTLAKTTTYQQLVSINIALRNWTSTTVSSLPVSVYISATVDGTITVTKTVAIPPAIHPHTDPSLKVVTLTVAATGIFVTRTFTYAISYPTTAPAAGVNIALSSSVYGQPVGTSPDGALWVDAKAGFFPSNDFPACTGVHPTTGGYPNTHFRATTLSEVTTVCGHAQEAYTYGTSTELHTTGNDNIPAVSFNVVGGVLGPLYPGAAATPIDYAVSNFGSPAHVASVTVTVKTSGTTVTGASGCLARWFSITGTGPSQTFPTGTTVVTAGVPTIMFTTVATTQTACKTKTVPLKFTAAP